ncbi:hypothetical protein [Lutibaculum baratangense]|uniref:Uncharacterized protein n=1 Tax=Lutibaculum baratangense AMV1 TaxID=631454 RepID=V4QRW5_9HYPH|nr:hypothetical protein [Lutibaculum baratangense]ESR22482.1 hypothetical protein N177_4212 [Lutibaculum baratangense AMV1]
MQSEILEGYATAGPELIALYEAVPSAEIYALVRDLLPPGPARAADIGAGTGRASPRCWRRPGS